QRQRPPGEERARSRLVHRLRRQPGRQTALAEVVIAPEARVAMVREHFSAIPEPPERAGDVLHHPPTAGYLLPIELATAERSARDKLAAHPRHDRGESLGV